MQALLNAATEYSDRYSAFRVMWNFQKSKLMAAKNNQNIQNQLAIIAFDFANEMDNDLDAFRKYLEEDEKVIRMTSDMLIRHIRTEHHQKNLEICVGLESLVSCFAMITDYTA